jgi:outer membrane immunogenic protein
MHCREHLISEGNKMKHTLLAAAVLSSGIIVAPAFAADMAPATAPAYKAAPMAPVSAYNWTGFYVGGNVGGGWSSLSSSVLSPGSAAFPVGTAFTKHSLSGVLGGIQGGFNWQTGHWVLGVEGEYTWADIDGSATTVSVPLPAFSAVTTAKIKDIALATGRVGYAEDNWLFYAKGGGAWGETSSNGTVFTGGTVFETSSSSTDRSGWVVGAGIEWGFAPNWSAKLEYDHIDFGSKTFTSLGSVTGTSLFSSSEKIDEVKGGVNYRFNWWGGPVVAKY